MLPGVNAKMLKQVEAADPKRMKHVEAIVLSMTPEERKKPEIINGSRRARIAKGARPADQRSEPAARAVPGDAEDDEEGGGRAGGWEVPAEYVWAMTAATRVGREAVAVEHVPGCAAGIRRISAR